MAKPETSTDGSVNLMVWHCTIPGKAGVSPPVLPISMTIQSTICFPDYVTNFPELLYDKLVSGRFVLYLIIFFMLGIHERAQLKVSLVSPGKKEKKEWKN